ncbi:Radical SAM domain protein [Desulfosporosinus metallidurans]|uniref:Radical SAM domain protein n=1 Tax=Desulfosporosinus metallidurans TaxID=1888891 RepID=A0A1Q8QHM9_9FIRM|nr:Radical SAM domain protein [Desulfosporosinus metallidurans]
MVHDIYIKRKKNYWIDLSVEIENYCRINGIKHNNYFYHKELVEARKQGLTLRR